MSSATQDVCPIVSTTEMKRERQSSSWLWGVVVLGAGLRIIALGHKSFWLDEIASVFISRLPKDVFWFWIWHSEGNMILYYIMLRPWLHFGLSESWVRVFSVVAGIASVPVMYLLGARLFTRRTGIVAALFLALNTCAIVYSQEARAYSLLVLSVTLASYLFVRLVQEPSYAAACAYALVAGITLYFHYFAVLVIFSHVVSLPFLPHERRPWRQLFVAAGLLTVLGAPVFWMIHIQPVSHLDWVPRPSLLEVYHLAVFLAAETGKGLGIVVLLIDLVLLFLFFQRLARNRRDKQFSFESWTYIFVACCLLAPIAVTLLISLRIPVFFHRFLIICLPAWILATAGGVEQILTSQRRKLAVIVLCAFSFISTVVSYTQPREDWRGAARYLMANAASSDRVLYYYPVGFFATENYRDWLTGGNLNRPQGIQVKDGDVAWQQQIEAVPRVWLVEYPATQAGPRTQELHSHLETHFSLAAQEKFKAVTITEYRRK